MRVNARPSLWLCIFRDQSSPGSSVGVRLDIRVIFAKICSSTRFVAGGLFCAGVGVARDRSCVPLNYDGPAGYLSAFRSGFLHAARDRMLNPSSIKRVQPSKLDMKLQRRSFPFCQLRKRVGSRTPAKIGGADQ
jgi:hypothetical protein